MSRYALIVGIGEYKSLKKLTKPKTDAQAVHDLLQRHGNFDEIHLLQDEKASYKNLSERLEYVLLKQGSKAKAEVLLYFTGHGFTAGPNKYDQQGYLATHDCAVTVKDRTTTHAEQAISFQFLNGLIGDADLSGLAIFLDCCHSEFFIEQALIAKNLSNCFEKPSYFLSAACRSFEQAYAERDQPHSVYTGALLQALCDETAGDVKASEAHDKVRRQLKGSGQEPISLGLIDSLTVVAYRPATVAPTMSELCPYQGLRAFTPETAEFFFGRRDEVGELCAKLTRAKFVPVLGPSGSGKSSVVRAGLVTRLLAEGWQVVTMKPDDEPMAHLKAGLRALFEQQKVSAGEQRRWVEVLGAEGLLAMVRQWPDNWRVLLVVDQFEEVFTRCQKAVQQQFISQLVAVGQATGQVDYQTGSRAALPLAVVMTMRSDFVDDWLSTGQSVAVIHHDTVWLGPLMGENLAAAIVEPARKQGYGFGEGLLELLLADVEKEDNCLPLLEFALTELWEQRDPQKRVLTAAAYRAMGGLKGALNKRAEAVYEKLRPVDQQWAKRICLQLVRIGREEKDTRQRQPKQGLLNMGGQNSQTRQTIADVIKDLIDGRLLVSDGEVATVAAEEVERSDAESTACVDLAHEALLEGWKQFVLWRQEDRDLRRLVQRLEDAYEDWQERGQDERYLLSHGLLSELREQRAQLSEILTERRPELEVFFSVSDEREQTNVAALELALAKSQLQENARKVREKFQAVPAQTVPMSLLAIELVGESQTWLNEVTYPATDVLHRAFSNICERLNLDGHSASVTSIAFSPQGDRIISGSADSTLRLWDLAGNLLGKPFTGHSGWIRSVAFSPQGDRIISGSTDKTLQLWNLSGYSLGEPFVGHRAPVRSVAFNPQGDKISSGSSDRTLRLWDLAGNPLSKPFTGHSGWVNSVAFSPQGNLIVSGSDDNTLRLWDLTGDFVGEPFAGHSSQVSSVAFSPQGDLIVSGSADKTLRLWDLAGNSIGEPFAGHSSKVSCVAFSPQSDSIVSGSDDNTVRLWDLASSLLSEPLAGHRGKVNSVAFSPQGDSIVSGSSDKTLRLWDSAGNPISTPFPSHSGEVWTATFNPQGDRIISGSGNKMLRLWDLDGNRIGKPFANRSAPVRSVAFSPQGNLIVSGSDDSGLRLWDLEGNSIGKSLFGHINSITSVAFSPQGDLIVSGSSDGTLRLWDLADNFIVTVFFGHSGEVNSVAFSPQGDLIVSGSADKTLRLWDLEGNSIGEPFAGHIGKVNAVAFSPQGDLIISGSADKTLRLWDLEGNFIGEPFAGHSGEVNSVAFSPQGDRVVSGSDDNTLRLWHCGHWEDELQYCCNMLMHHSALTLPQTETARKASEVCQQVWTRPQSAEFLVAQGSALARTGKVEKAIEKFNRAQQLDATLDFDAVARATELAAWG